MSFHKLLSQELNHWPLHCCNSLNELIHFDNLRNISHSSTMNPLLPYKWMMGLQTIENMNSLKKWNHCSQNHLWERKQCVFSVHNSCAKTSAATEIRLIRYKYPYIQSESRLSELQEFTGHLHINGWPINPMSSTSPIVCCAAWFIVHKIDFLVLWFSRHRGTTTNNDDGNNICLALSLTAIGESRINSITEPISPMVEAFSVELQEDLLHWIWSNKATR